MTVKLFIAGTDTNVGKTYISAGLLSAFGNKGYSTLGIKPVASGCIRIHGELQSEDTLALQQASSIKLPHEIITPFAFEPPIAPHIAAKQVGSEISVAQLTTKCQAALNAQADISVIEGCGGWYVPINSKETMADFVIANQLKVVLVVGMRLGCINHALLTYRAIQQDGVEIAGWIANGVDPAMENSDENIATLKEWLNIPCLGVVKHGDAIIDHLSPDFFNASLKILSLSL